MTRRYQRDELWLALIAAAVALIAFIFYFRHNMLLLYGDAVAHINIARRVFDSRDPGPLQLGTVWLPLPHILILPFVISHWMWRAGAGGAIPSMAAYIAGAVGMFRLIRGAVEAAGSRAETARVVAWFAALVYLGNPNLLYLQATPMTEPLYLAFFIWATVFFSEFLQQVRRNDMAASRSLRNCGILLSLCMLTRYDGWFAGVVFAVAAALTLRLSGFAFRDAPVRERLVPALESHTSGFSTRSAEPHGRLSPAAAAVQEQSLPILQVRPRIRFRRFLVLLAAVPVLWLVYNAAVWGNPLEFATGPYSAKGIERRTATVSMPHHPGYHNVKVATLYFLKDVKLVVADGRWQAGWLPLAAIGSGLVLLFARQVWPLLLLWVPLPFYALSVSRGGVPIFFPEWWPYSYYNVRYGLQLLPALAAGTAMVLWSVLKAAQSTARPDRRMWSHVRNVVAVAAAMVFVAGSYRSVWQRVPICLREARTNSVFRVPFEHELGERLRALPEHATVLMYLGEHVGALQTAGIPLRRTINETTHPYWKQALATPSKYVDYAVAFGDDAVAQAVKADAGRFDKILVVETPGYERATVFGRKGTR